VPVAGGFARHIGSLQGFFLGSTCGCFIGKKDMLAGGFNPFEKY